MPTFDDLAFVPATMTRLPLEGYRESCDTKTVLGNRPGLVEKPLELDIPILFVDTGVNFPETLATRDAIGEACGLEIRTLTPPQTMDEQTAELGVLYCTPEGQKECCRLRKIEPLRAVADQFDCLIGSLRRSEGGQRSFCPILAADPDMNVVRVNPLVTFDDDSLNGYIDEHSVILNPLHEQGYPTVSCNRCTTPVLENEPRRAGRWRHLGPWQAYCGINPTDLDTDTQTAVELPQQLIDKVLAVSYTHLTLPTILLV